VQAQVQSGVVFGATAALYGEITLKNGRVEQTNFDTYQMMRMSEVPPIDIHVVKSSAVPGGVGETGTSLIVPAIANAIFAATGKRLRKMPADSNILKQSV
jgi:isoquinoline 1-oxidoreductase beta subunit